jgi:hypothetical protein
LGAGSFDGAAWHLAADVGGLTANQWFYIVGTIDGANVTLYKNGTQVTQTAWVGSPSYDATVFTIGRRHDNSAPQFAQGTMAHAAIYNVALSAGTISNHYAAGH